MRVAAVQLGLQPLDLPAGRRLVAEEAAAHVVVDPHDIEAAGVRPVADAATLGSLELGASDPPYFSMTAEMACERAGTLDGVAGWFDCQLFGDIRMTNSPTANDRLQRPQAFL